MRDMYHAYDVRPSQPMSKIAGLLEQDFVMTVSVFCVPLNTGTSTMRSPWGRPIRKELNFYFRNKFQQTLCPGVFLLVARNEQQNFSPGFPRMGDPKLDLQIKEC
jgi:hypothetical protein